MAIKQLNPPLPMTTPKGEGFAHFLIDYGPESDLYWIVFVTETAEIWTYANKHVRASKNITLDRFKKSEDKTIDSVGRLGGIMLCTCKGGRMVTLG